MGTATSVEDVIFVDATSGPITVTVPTREDLIPPIPVWQNSFTIIKTDNTTNAVTVQNLSPGFGNSITTDIITRGCKTYYFGTWQVGQQPCFGVLASTATRIIQTGITEYFVATTGSDSTGNGFIGSPWATLQHAMDHISTSIDTAGFLARVRIGAGTFAGVGLKSYVGGGIVEFKGAGPASTTIDNGPNDGVYNTGEPFSSIPPNGCVFYINEVKIKTTNSVANAAAIFVNIGPVTIIIGEDPDNPGVAGHVTMDSGGSTAANALVTINGPAGSFLDSATAANNITLVGNIPAYLSADLSATAVLVGAYTISGTPAYSRNFIDVSDNSELSDFGTTFSGSATGVRFAVDGSSKMDSSDSAGTRYPGNAVGTIAPGGIYTGITDFVGAIGSLPAAIQNARAFVTNATAPVFGAIPGATGAVQAPVYADGTNWRYG